MPDIFEDRTGGLESPGYRAQDVAPSDNSDLAFTSRALFVGTPGDICLRTAGGDTVTLRNVGGGLVPLRVARVFATGTTAAGIVAIW